MRDAGAETQAIDQAQYQHVLEREALLSEAEGIALVGSYLWQPGSQPLWSDGFYRILGYEPGAVAPSAEAFYNRVHPDDLERVVTAQAAIKDGVLPDMTYRIQRADTGEERYLRGTGRIYQGSPAGGAWRMVGALLDITNRVQLEDRLRHAAKMEAVGALAAGIAHDFNNYLMVASGCLEMLELGGTAGASSAHLAAQGRYAVERCVKLTQQLLVFARRSPSQDEVIHLEERVPQIRDLLAPSLGPGIALNVDTANAPLPTRIDPIHLEQLLANLVINGRDAIRSRGATPGEITITLDEVTLTAPALLAPVEVAEGRWVRLQVNDNACGIKPEHLPRIFEPYFTTKEVGHGTGLGLAAAFGAVQQHAGHLTVESTPGEGTRFTVWLPRVDAVA